MGRAAPAMNMSYMETGLWSCSTSWEQLRFSATRIWSFENQVIRVVNCGSSAISRNARTGYDSAIQDSLEYQLEPE